jgi:hypothetical protein
MCSTALTGDKLPDMPGRLPVRIKYEAIVCIEARYPIEGGDSGRVGLEQSYGGG